MIWYIIGCLDSHINPDPPSHPLRTHPTSTPTSSSASYRLQKPPNSRVISKSLKFVDNHEIEATHKALKHEHKFRGEIRGWEGYQTTDEIGQNEAPRTESWIQTNFAPLPSFPLPRLHVSALSLLPGWQTASASASRSMIQKGNNTRHFFLSDINIISISQTIMYAM